MPQTLSHMHGAPPTGSVVQNSSRDFFSFYLNHILLKTKKKDKKLKGRGLFFPFVGFFFFLKVRTAGHAWNQKRKKKGDKKREGMTIRSTMSAGGKSRADSREALTEEV